MSNCILNIQKFSLHDGPGIRSVVFLKGCPLRCEWCSNPESQSFEPEVLCDHDKCTNCMRCTQTCPSNAIRLEAGKIHIDKDLCTRCNTCIHACPMHALTMEGKTKSVEDIVKVVMQDQDFYDESGGGITLSGGEVLSQPNFAMDIIKACKEKNLHVAIETTGYSGSETFQKVIQEVDLILFDLKHYDAKKHIEKTKVSNQQILENMAYAISLGKQIIARIPVIPAYNDSREDAHQLSKLLKDMGIVEVNILPFHQFGSKKYDSMNKDYKMKDTPQLYREDLEEYQQVFSSYGLHCFF